jgi:hypothetical protein
LGGIAVNRAGEIFVADNGNATIRKFRQTAVLQLLREARIISPEARGRNRCRGEFRVAWKSRLDAEENLLVADGPTLRRVTAQGVDDHSRKARHHGLA